MMKNALYRFGRNEEGVAYIELAFTLFVMIIVLTSLVEVTSFIRVKNKMNQVSDHMGELLSTAPNWNPALHVDPMLPAAQDMAYPFGVNISARFCQGAFGIDMGGPGADVVPEHLTGNDYNFNVTYDNADCSLVGAPGGGVLTIAACTDAEYDGTYIGDDSRNPGMQFVVTAASCRYTPYFSALEPFFGDLIVTSTSVTPMRYKMQWN